MNLELDGVSLREIDLERDDLSKYLGWLRDVDNNPFISSARKDFEMSELRSYISHKNEIPEALLLGIFYGKSDNLVGKIKLDPIDLIAKSAWLGIMIGEPEARGIGVGYRSMVLITTYAFETLKLMRIFLGVDPLNVAAISLYQKVGFINSDEGKNIMSYSR